MSTTERLADPSTRPPMGLADEADLVDQLYDPLVSEARHAFAESEVVGWLTDASIAAIDLDRFLIEFCARGVHMTRPVDSWIRRAGARCVGFGLIELGDALRRHAEHEAGHHELLIADTFALVGRWNDAGRRPLDAQALLDQEPGVGVQTYVRLHEDTIDSSVPFGQLAIEYEIERLSVTVGPLLLANIARVCGDDRIELLSFLTDHVALDQAHTVFNRRQLNALLEVHPTFARELAAAGAAALHAYWAFLSECADVVRRP